MNGFNYVITTELKLAPGTLQSLINEIKQIDNQLRANNALGTVAINARLAPQSISVIQRQVGAIRASMPVTLKLNEGSIITFRRQVQSIISEANRQINVAIAPVLNAPRPTQASQPGVSGSVADLRNRRLNQQQLDHLQRQANLERTVAMNVRDHAQAELTRARALEVTNNAQLQQIRLKEALLRLEQREAMMLASQERYRQVQYRTADIISRTRAREERRRVSQVPRTTTIDDLERNLKNPDMPLEEKKRQIEALVQNSREFSREIGQNLTRSFTIFQRNADGTISKFQTLGKEITKFGEVIDRGDRSFASMASRMVSNVLMYSVVTMGFFQITQGVTASIRAMAEFENQFIRIQNLANQSTSDDITPGQTRKDVFNIAGQYNLDAVSELSPVYAQVLRRQDLFKNRNELNEFTRTLIRAGYISQGGSGLGADDMLRISKDAIAVYTQGGFANQPSGEGVKNFALFNDFLASISKQGADIEQTYDALSTLSSYSSQGFKMQNIASLVGAFSLRSDDSGAEMGNKLKVFLGNLLEGDSADIREGRRLLTGKEALYDNEGNQYSPEYLLELAAKRMPEMSREEVRRAASLLSNHGERAQADNIRIIESLGVYSQFAKMKPEQYRGEAENRAMEQAQSLSREFKGLINEVNELSVALGEAGLMRGLKTIVNGLTSLVSIMNSAVNAFNDLKTTAERFNVGPLFEMTSGVLGLIVALKSLQVAFRMLPTGVRGQFENMGKRFIDSSSKPNKGTGVGTAIGGIAGEVLAEVLLGRKKNWNIDDGADTPAKRMIGKTTLAFGNAATVVTNALTKFGKGLLNILKIFGRLSIPLAITGAVISGIVYARNKINERNAAEQQKLTATMADPELRNEFADNLRRFMELDANKNNNLEESLEKDRLGKYLKGHGMSADILGALTGSVDYKDRRYFKLNNGEKAYIDKDNVDLTITKLYEQNEQIESVAKSWDNAVSSAKNYSSILTGISDILTRASDATRQLTIRLTENSLSSIGTENAPDSILSNIFARQGFAGDLGVKRSEIQSRINSIQEASSNTQRNIANARGDVALQKDGSELLAQFDQRVEELRNSGEISKLVGEFQDNDALRALAAQVSNYEQFKESTKGARDELDKLNLTMIENESALKSLYIQYATASAGIQGFDRKVSELDLALATSELRSGGKPSYESVGIMSEQVSLYQRQISSIQGRINTITSMNPSLDFSEDTLFGGGQLDENQVIVRDLKNDMLEYQSRIVSTQQSMGSMTESLREMSVNTNIYSDAWNIVSDRVQTVKNALKEIKDLNLTRSFSDTFINMRSQAYGRGFDPAAYRTDNTKTELDRLLSIYETLSKLISTYGEDTAALEQGLRQSGVMGTDRYKEARELLGDNASTNAIAKSLVSTLPDSINRLAKELEKLAYSDPTQNTAEAQRRINDEMSYLRSSTTGGVDWYNSLRRLSEMFSSYLDTQKKIELSQTTFNETGFGFGNLSRLKQIKYSEDVNLLYTQMQAVSNVLSTLAEGTNNWHVVLQDAVALQEKIVQLENAKTETARRYFELTGKGLYPYINARAYGQSRDYSMNSRNLSTAINNHRNNTPSNYTEELVGLQIIADMQNALVESVNEYRTALVDAFKAGALSLEEYMNKLHDLRDIQRENREAAIEMVNSLQGTFQSSLADALKSGMEGNMDAGFDFIKNIKSGVAGAISSQISSTMLTQSGLMDNVNTMIQGIVTAMTSGGTLNFGNFQQLIEGATNQMLPWIEQIANATNGMFGIMKDQVYNAPSGFKIDNYLYEMQKGKTYDDVKAWLPGRGATNEAGAPVVVPNPNGGGTVVLPPMTSTPTGKSKLGQVVRPIESIGSGSLNTPISIRNPVREILNGLITLKSNYDAKLPTESLGNVLVHEKADELRNALRNLSPEIAEAIGDGETGKSLEELVKYMADNTGLLSEFDMNMTSGIGGVGQAVQGTYAKFDSLIAGIGGVVSAVSAIRQGGSPSPAVAGSRGGTTVTDSKGKTHHFASFSELVNRFGYEGAMESAKNIIDKYGAGSIAGYPGSSGSSGSSSNSSSKSSSRVTGKDYVKMLSPAGHGASVHPDYVDKYLAKGYTLRYHTGGIAGIMNFLNPSRLSSNEVNAVLQKEETVFQKGQLGSLFESVLGRGSSGGKEALDINITINGDASGMDESSVNRAIQDGIVQAVREMGRQARLNNLQVKGVSHP